jgi:hypothetical protein
MPIGATTSAGGTRSINSSTNTSRNSGASSLAAAGQWAVASAFALEHGQGAAGSGQAPPQPLGQEGSNLDSNYMRMMAALQVADPAHQVSRAGHQTDPCLGCAGRRCACWRPGSTRVLTPTAAHNSRAAPPTLSPKQAAARAAAAAAVRSRLSSPPIPALHSPEASRAVAKLHLQELSPAPGGQQGGQLPSLGAHRYASDRGSVGRPGTSGWRWVPPARQAPVPLRPHLLAVGPGDEDAGVQARSTWMAGVGAARGIGQSVGATTSRRRLLASLAEGGGAAAGGGASPLRGGYGGTDAVFERPAWQGRRPLGRSATAGLGELALRVRLAGLSQHGPPPLSGMGDAPSPSPAGPAHPPRSPQALALALAQAQQVALHAQLQAVAAAQQAVQAQAQHQALALAQAQQQALGQALGQAPPPHGRAPQRLPQRSSSLASGQHFARMAVTPLAHAPPSPAQLLAPVPGSQAPPGGGSLHGGALRLLSLAASAGLAPGPGGPPSSVGGGPLSGGNLLQRMQSARSRRGSVMDGGPGLPGGGVGSPGGDRRGGSPAQVPLTPGGSVVSSMLQLLADQSTGSMRRRQQQ